MYNTCEYSLINLAQPALRPRPAAQKVVAKVNTYVFFTILLRERNPLLFYSERGILYYSTPREESFTILLRERKLLLSLLLLLSLS